jgi:RHS repeat-associated protein
LSQGAGTTVYTYDPASNLATVTLPNGVQSTFSYDGLNRLTSLQAASGAGQPIASFGYQLDATGNQTSVNELSGRSVQWNYDGIYRLTGETVTGDPIGKNGTVSYGLDPVGNRLSITSNLFDISSGVFSFNPNDFLNSENYDANGNVIIAAGAAFNYDFQDRLVNVTDLASNAQIQLAYDALGNRVSKTVGGITTQYLVDDQNPTGLPQVVEEVVNGVVQKSYTYGYILLAQNQWINGTLTPRFYGYDGGLNVRFLTDAGGAITDTYDYDAYGNLINKSGSTANNYLYRGEQFDSDLGLYYLRARYYNPATGRLLGRDPAPGDVTAPETFHKFSYAGNNPVNLADPTGQEEEEEASLLSRISLEIVIPVAEIGSRVACILNGISDAFTVIELFQSQDYVQAGVGLAYLAVNLSTCKAEFKVAANLPAKEGIYEFTAASGKTYVGQSKNIVRRIEQHLKSGKLLPKDLPSVKITPVSGGKTAREIAEQLRINELGGVGNLENIRNPIGPGRSHLLPPP